MQQGKQVVMVQGTLRNGVGHKTLQSAIQLDGSNLLYQILMEGRKRKVSCDECPLTYIYIYIYKNVIICSFPVTSYVVCHWCYEVEPAHPTPRICKIISAVSRE